MKIFIVTHKPLPYLKNDLYEPIQVNSNVNPSIYDGIIQDNTLNNISSKNNFFCELTATYWLWKNTKKNDFIGLCHYRRYFNFYPNQLSLKPSCQKKITKIELLKNRIAKIDIDKQRVKIINDLKTHDIILPRPRKMKISISEDYISNHRESDWIKTKEIITCKYPEFEKSISKYLDNNNKFYQCNMMITTSQIWDNYHEWLFEILFDLEKNIVIPKDIFQRRIFGFISERLLNLYVLHHNLKIKEYPILFIND
jgi:hypothetical protein